MAEKPPQINEAADSARHVLDQDRLNFEAVKALPDDLIVDAKKVAGTHLEQNRDAIEQAAIDSAAEAGVETSYGTYSQDPEKFAANAHERGNSLALRGMQARSWDNDIETDGSFGDYPDNRTVATGKLNSHTPGSVVHVRVSQGGHTMLTKRVIGEDGSTKQVSVNLGSDGSAKGETYATSGGSGPLSAEGAAKYAPKILDELEAAIAEAEAKKKGAQQANTDSARSVADDLFS